MSFLFEIGAYVIHCKHLQLKQNTWYFRRRIPEDVQGLHRHPGTRKSQTQLFFSLKTCDKGEAARRVDAHTRRLDALWRSHRGGSGAMADPLASVARLEVAGLKPGDGERRPDHPSVSDFIDSLAGPYEVHEHRPQVSRQDRVTLDILNGAPVPRTLGDARKKHFELGKGPKNKIAEQQFERAWNVVLEVAGDITLDLLRREHANEYVRRLAATGVGAETIKRYLSQVRPVIVTGIREFELARTNPFEGVHIPNKDEGPRKPRVPYKMPQLDAIQSRCRAVDDERRWAIAMLSDTMARLSEVAGLRKEDVHLDATIPYINLRHTPERRLKNDSSVRLVPLVGEALWAAQRAMTTNGPLLFPVFQPKHPSKPFTGAGASAPLGKWLKDNKLAVEEGQTIHSFRHTMRDRLRDVEAPSDLIDRIGGWKGQGVGETYGKGQGLELMHKYMLLTVRNT